MARGFSKCDKAKSNSKTCARVCVCVCLCVCMCVCSLKTTGIEGILWSLLKRTFIQIIAQYSKLR
uniref:Uncharacterized protein n=1 Tax=Anguilla anguilla TaxID=7936 RepID=A0A0E9R7R8_ANGAN